MDDYALTVMLIPVLKLLLAGMLGGIIGWERERHGRSAGFRTNILVCIGACLMMLVSEHIQTKYAHLGSQSVIRLDPARIAAQIVTGIGFLGAGAIIKWGASVRGLTTAACLWIVAALGMAVGCGFIIPAVATVVLALIILLVLKAVSQRVRHHYYRLIRIEVSGAEDRLDQIERLMEEHGLKVQDVRTDMDKGRDRITYEIPVRYRYETKLRAAARKTLEEIPGVQRLTVKSSE